MLVWGTVHAIVFPSINSLDIVRLNPLNISQTTYVVTSDADTLDFSELHSSREGIKVMQSGPELLHSFYYLPMGQLKKEDMFCGACRGRWGHTGGWQYAT